MNSGKNGLKPENKGDDMLDLWGYVVQAGVIGYVLVGISIIACGVALERYIFWFSQPRNIGKELDPRLVAAFKRKNKDEILKIATDMKGLEGEALKIVANNINCEEDTPLDIAMVEVIESSTRFLWILELCSGIAPMFGILGTVAGIIVSFQGMSGDMPDTGVMVAGISVSMLTTAIGLIVALFALVPATHLGKIAHKRQLQIASRLQEYWIQK